MVSDQVTPKECEACENLKIFSPVYGWMKIVPNEETASAHHALLDAKDAEIVRLTDLLEGERLKDARIAELERELSEKTWKLGPFSPSVAFPVYNAMRERAIRAEAARTLGEKGP